MNIKNTIALLAFGALVAIAMMQWLPVDEPAPVAATPSSLSEFDALRLQLSRLERDHAATLHRLSELEQFFASSKLGLEQSPAEALAPVEDLDMSVEEAVELIPQSTSRSRSLARIERAGLTVEEFEAIEQRVDAENFSRFEDQWLRQRQRYLERGQTPSPVTRLRDELGDDAYDRYLFASGRPNRVRVRGVMEGSEAEMAGLKGGDTVISYGSKRVFNFDELRRLSYEGQPGETVVLEVQGADGSVSQLVMSRGPLGLYSDGGWSEAP
jgi:hypothetical protein